MVMVMLMVSEGRECGGAMIRWMTYFFFCFGLIRKVVLVLVFVVRVWTFLVFIFLRLATSIPHAICPHKPLPSFVKNSRSQTSLARSQVLSICR